MPGTERRESPIDEKRNAILVAYLRALDTGNAPNRNQILAENPDLAEELSAFFEAEDQPLRSTIARNDAVEPLMPTWLPSRPGRRLWNRLSTTPRLSAPRPTGTSPARMKMFRPMC